MIREQNIDARQHFISLSFLDNKLESNYRAEHNKKTLGQVRVAIIIAAVLYAIFAFLDFIVIPDGRWKALMFRFGFVIPILILGYVATYKHYFKENMQALVMPIIYVAGLGIALIAYSYQDVRSELHLTGTLLPIFWAFIYSGLRFINAVKVSLALILTYEFIFFGLSNISVEILVIYNFFLLAALIIGVLGGYTIESYFRRDFINEQIIRREKLKNEQLLLNILPKNIAEELKTQSGTIARNYDQITVLFADLVEFSAWSLKNTAHDIVRLLNDIFSMFDGLTDKYNLEKIKTIGDAYMVTNNLREIESSNVESVARFAFDMQRAVDSFNIRSKHNVRLRIGIHSGPAVAGVIGVKKFVYDVWGSTVNVASRMEATCPKNEIQVSEATYELLKDKFIFEARGKIEMKGHGDLHAFLLKGEKALK